MSKINLNIEAETPQELLAILRDLAQSSVAALASSAVTVSAPAEETAASAKEEKPTRTSRTKTKTETKVEPETKVEETKPESKSDSVITMKELRAAATQLAQQDREAVQAITSHFDVPRISAIEEADIEEAYEMVQKALEALNDI